MPESLLSAAIPPVLAFLLAKLSEIGAQQRVSRVYKQGQEELSFWKDFVEAETLVCSADEMVDVRSTAKTELEAIRTRIRAVRNIRVAVLPNSKFRRLFLLYATGQLRSWVARTVFYVLTVYGLLLTYELFTEQRIRNWTIFPIACSIVIMVFVLAVWSRSIALRVDRLSLQ